MIWYFQKSLTPSIRAQLDAQNQDLDSWEDVVEKAVNIKAKTLLQSVSSIYKMDFRCFQGNSPVKKEEKHSGKAKFTNTSFADIPSRKQLSSTYQTSFAYLEKDQNRDLWRGRG